jgi:TatD DNase family protein
MNSNETTDETSLHAMIDTHCHLDDEAFAGDLDHVLESSRAADVNAWILIGYAPDRWDTAARMAKDIPGMAHSLGVHPSHAREWNDDIADRLHQQLLATGAVAVGEFGLDFYRDNASLEIQREAVLGQLHIARELDLPAIFHMRDAENEMLDLLEAEAELPRMVFHSFDGSGKLTDFILQHDAWIGVGGLATRQRSVSLRDQLKRFPLASILLETDSPYLVPAKQKDRRNVPAHVRTVAKFLSDFYQCPVEDIARQTTQNAESLFGRLLP